MWRTCSEDLQIVLRGHTIASGTTPNATPRKSNANELWELLKTRYKKHDGISTVIDWGNLINTRLVDDGSTSMEQQLAQLATHRSRVALNGFVHEDWQYAALLFLALPPSFKSIKSTFLDGLTDPRPSLSMLSSHRLSRRTHATLSRRTHATLRRSPHLTPSLLDPPNPAGRRQREENRAMSPQKTRSSPLGHASTVD